MKKQLEDDLLACENKHAEEKSNLNDELEAMRAVKEQLDKVEKCSKDGEVLIYRR